MSLFSTTADVTDDFEEWETLETTTDAAELYLFPSPEDEPELPLGPEQSGRKLATILVAITAVLAIATWLALPVARQQIELLPIDPINQQSIAAGHDSPAATNVVPVAPAMQNPEPAQPSLHTVQTSSATVPDASQQTAAVSWPEAIEQKFQALLRSVPTLFTPEPSKWTTEIADATTREEEASVIRITEPAMEVHVLNDVRLKLFTGERENAKVLLLDLIETYPPAFEARRVLAGLLLQEGNQKQATGVLAAVDQNAPPELREMKAQQLLQVNQVTDAVQLLETNPPDISTGTRYFALLAALLQRDGRFDDSLNVYQQLLSVEPDNSNWLVGYAIGLEQTGKFASARTGYQAAMTAGPVSAVMEQFIHSKIRELSFR